MKFLLVVLGSIGFLAAQPTLCTTTSAPNVVRADGLTERVGDILYSCTGAPGSTLMVNLSVGLSTPITNRISSTNVVTGTVLTADSGAGPQAVLVQPVLQSQGTLVWNGVLLTLSPQGTLAIQISGLRANAAAAGVGGQIIALLSSSGGFLPISQSQLLVSVVELGLYSGSSGALICAQNGSPLPTAPFGFSDLIADGTAFASTRVTEGFGGAFSPRSAPANFDADTGTRLIVTYSGFPQAAQLFVPNVIAGSDAVQPTAGGDMGVAASGGSYSPSASGSLLLVLVAGADSTGAGGSLVYTVGGIGSGVATFNAVTQLTINGGVAYAVYEVADANPSSTESAQFPTFLGLAPNAVTTAVQTGESVTYAPVSNVVIASATAPIPRFVARQPPNDCGIVGDCGASYFPQLTVSPAPLVFTLGAGAPSQTQYVPVTNSGGGVLYWTASVIYTNGSGWLAVQPASGMDDGTVRIDAIPGNLGLGTYQATLTIDGGTAGIRLVAITLTISQAATLAPQITSVLNAASFAAVPVVPGSLTTIMGLSFSGGTVTASFNGLPATILFSDATQINLLVPAALTGLSSAQLSVTVGALTSLPVTVAVAPFEPAIFPGAIANQDATLNSISNGAAAGSVIYFYATGLSGSGTITAQIGDTQLTNLYYAGPAPGYPGVQQVNLTIPSGLGAITTGLSVCGNGVCSVPVPLTLK